MFTWDQQVLVVLWVWMCRISINRMQTRITLMRRVERLPVRRSLRPRRKATFRLGSGGSAGHIWTLVLRPLQTTRVYHLTLQ